VITDKWGYTSLAGSSEYIIFKIAPGDLEHIIASRGLKPMELMGSEAGFVGTNCMIDVSQLKKALHGLSKKLPEKKHLRNRLSAYFSG